MAQKRALVEEEPPSASSSSSEEDVQVTDNEQEVNGNQETPKATSKSESSDEEEEEEDDDEEQQQKVSNNKPYVQKPSPTIPTIAATKTPQPNSPSDSGSDSESDLAQSSPTASDFTIQPIASKPMENPKKPTTSKPSSAKRKRPVTTETNDEKNAKKKKAKVEEGMEKKSGGSLNRLWSEDDETAILKGMADFHKEKGADPNAYMGAFHDFIKESLSVEVSRGQLMDKVRRLKKKYAGKGENGADIVFSKPHENKCFELSKKVWEGGKEISNGVEENGKSESKRARKAVKSKDSLALQPKENRKVVVSMKERLKGEKKDLKVVNKVGDFWSAYRFLKHSVEMEASSGLSMKEPLKSFMVESMSLIGKTDANELEKKWKSLQADEAALYLKRVGLIKEQTKLVLDALKASKD